NKIVAYRGVSDHQRRGARTDAIIVVVSNCIGHRDVDGPCGAAAISEDSESARSQAVCGSHNATERAVGCARSARRDQNAVASIIGELTIRDEKRTCPVRLETDARIREIAYCRFLDVQGLSRIELDADTARISTVNLESSEVDDVVHP